MEKFKSVKVWMNFCYPVAPVTKTNKNYTPPVTKKIHSEITIFFLEEEEPYLL